MPVSRRDYRRKAMLHLMEIDVSRQDLEAVDLTPIYLEFELQGRPWLLNVKPRAISLAIDNRENYTFDREGRPYAAFVDGRNYRRGMEGRVLSKYSAGERGSTPRVREFLDAEGVGWFLGRVRGRLDQLAAGAPGIQGTLEREEKGLFRFWLQRLQRWDCASLDADVRRFHGVYRNVSILPPDQYMALVVQSSEGCPWNRCTFCNLYRDRDFRLKGQAELADHVRAIVELLGEGVKLRRSVFLGDANMLCAPAPRLRDVLSSVDRLLTLAGGPHGAFYGFADAGGVLRQGKCELEELRTLGLRRLYLGLETGNARLLRWLNKPNSPSEMIRAVKHLHQAGLQAGVIVLLGVGGTAFAKEHERDTVAALNAMALGSGDIIYFSPLVEHEDLDYARESRRLGFGVMDYATMREQQKRMAARLQSGAGRPLTSIYDIRDFVY